MLCLNLLDHGPPFYMTTSASEITGPPKTNVHTLGVKWLPTKILHLWPGGLIFWPMVSDIPFLTNQFG